MVTGWFHFGIFRMERCASCFFYWNAKASSNALKHLPLLADIFNPFRKFTEKAPVSWCELMRNAPQNAAIQICDDVDDIFFFYFFLFIYFFSFVANYNRFRRSRTKNTANLFLTIESQVCRFLASFQLAKRKCKLAKFATWKVAFLWFLHVVNGVP